MAVLDGIKPRVVFKYFEEICNIPHGSGNTKAISDYLVSFAKDRGLKYIQDELNNVIIFKPGTEGYENSQPVILQGHIDMVCEKTSDSTIDFEKDGLELIVKDNVITANKTTLGGDDGIAVAYTLAILADEGNISHPPIEAVFTVDEEVGMLGAVALDCSPLKAKTMINIDSEDEGILLVSCAGGVSVICHLPFELEDASGMTFYEVKVNNATGGHSGVEIIKESANATKVLARVLYAISEKVDYRLVSISGGLKDNAIPREATAIIAVAEDARKEISSVVVELDKIVKAEYHGTDKEIFLTVHKSDAMENVMTEKSTRKIVNTIYNMPNGIMKMSQDIDNLVQTSLNVGITKTLEHEVICSFAVRSSVESEKKELVSRLTSIMNLCGGSVEIQGDYPGWEYKADSRLRDVMIKAYKRQYGSSPKIEAIHAGLECGIFSGKIPGLDCVSFGPQMDDIHTPSESLYIDSVERTWEYLIKVLEMLK
ncbi:MAG: aminoacyl-histidine dipeptidase [Lachnospiraceae bacterium]|nr:aminoacyl-histidine dipeptidase [Lachnospiraceae bacterium]